MKIAALCVSIAIFGSTSAFAATGISLPKTFLGRWEEKKADCLTPIDLRDDHGWLLVEPRKIEAFEGFTAKITSIRKMSPAKFGLKADVTDFGEVSHENYIVQLSDDGRTLDLNTKDGKSHFVRCAS